MWACTYGIDRRMPAKLMDRLTATLVNRLTATLVNRLTAKLVNRLTPKLMNHLTAKPVVVKLHLTNLNWKRWSFLVQKESTDLLGLNRKFIFFFPCEIVQTPKNDIVWWDNLKERGWRGWTIMTLNSRFYDNRRTQERNSGQNELVIFYSQRKQADISRCHHWFPRKMTAEIPYWCGVATQIWVVLLIGRVTREICFKQSEALPRSGSETSTVWNFWSRLLRFLRSHFAGKQVGRPSTRKGRFRAPKTQVFKKGP